MYGSLNRTLILCGLLGLGVVASPGTALAQEDPPAEDNGDPNAPGKGPGLRPVPMLPGGPMRPGMPGPGPRPRPPGAGPDEPLPEPGDEPPRPDDEETGDDEDAGGGTSTGRGGTTTVSPGGNDSRQRPPVVDGNAKVTIDFVDAEVMDIIRYMAEITGRNFILGEKLTGKITIISHQPVTVAEAYEAFLSALEVAGYTTVTVGDATKVVKTGEAAKSPLRVYSGEYVPYTNNFVTQIFQLDNVSVKDISTVVKELASTSARVIAYSPTNTIIITDTATNIRRIHRIITELDVAAPKSRLEIIPLQYAEAEELATIIREVYGVEGESEASTDTGSSSRRTSRRRRRAEPEPEETEATNVGGEGKYISKIISDERTNSLIVQANEEAMASIVELISKLDVDVDPSSRSQIHVVYLEHAKAEDVAQVLSNLASGSTSSSRSQQGQAGRVDQRGRRLPPGGPGGGPPGGPEGGPDLRADGAVAAFDSGMRIASDENTNSLVIIASPEEFRIIKSVIDKLDIRRKQVFVEAVILEMASDETFDFGLGYHTGAVGPDGNYSAYSAQLNGSSLGLSAADLVSGLAMGVFGEAIDVSVIQTDGSVATMSVPAFGIALNALQSNSAVNIISTPNVLTTDNEEAKLTVGRNVPFPVSTGRDSNNNPIVSYQREDVAITLKVTPQINESNYVTLEVFQEVQEIEEDSQGLDVSSAGFITSKRSAETTVVVQDNQTVVIGGLIGNTDTEVETKIPVLGDLPLVGVLFRGTRVKSRKTNLLVFLTPHVISEPADLEEIYRIKVAQRNEFIRRFYGRTQEEQQQELASLLRFSMNLVDEPSVYRTKIDTSSNVTTITGTGEVTSPQETAPAPTPEEEPAVPDADEPELEDAPAPGQEP